MTNEFLYNWQNELSDGTSERISSSIQSLVKSGYSLERAKDLIISSGESLEEVNEVFSSWEESLKTAQVVSEGGFPMSYDDVKDDVEKLVRDMSSDDFVDLIACSGRKTMVRVSHRKEDDLRALVRIVKARLNDEFVMEELHGILRPHVEAAIHDSRGLSKDSDISITEGEGDSFIADDDGRSYILHLSSRTCTCPRFVFGGFAHLGIPCEHIIVARRSLTPEIDHEEGVDYKLVHAQFQGSERFAWCGRHEKEVKISTACISGECPYLVEDCGRCVHCGFLG